MHNLLNKFEAEVSEVKDDAGVVAIEYVVVAGVIVALITGAMFAGLGTDLKNKLDALITP